MNVSHSIAGTDIARGFHPDGRYEFKIDANGDAVEELTYRFAFAAKEADGAQAYELHRLTGSDAADPHAEGRTCRRRGDGPRDRAGGRRPSLGRRGRGPVLDRLIRGTPLACGHRVVPPARGCRWKGRRVSTS